MTTKASCFSSVPFAAAFAVYSPIALQSPTEVHDSYSPAKGEVIPSPGIPASGCGVPKVPPAGSETDAPAGMLAAATAPPAVTAKARATPSAFTGILSFTMSGLTNPVRPWNAAVASL